MRDIVREKAKRAAILLTGGITESHIVHKMCSSLREITNGIHTKTATLKQDDIKRMEFEIVAFATAIFISQEIPKYVAQLKSWGLNKTDVEAIRTFNAELLTHLERVLKKSGHLDIKEKVITITDRKAKIPNYQMVLGEPLDLAKRLSRYAREQASTDYVKLFCRYFSYTTNTSLLPALRIIASGFTHSILEVVRIVSDDIFDRGHKNSMDEKEKASVIQSRANQSPLDQQCKSLLEKTKEYPHPSFPYSLQLVIWGLENLELIGHWAKFQTALLEQSKILLTAEPHIVLKLLMNPDDSDWEPGDVELDSDDPHEVAGLLIENFLGNLAKVMPAFRD